MATDKTFELTNTSYAAFDATSLKSLIIDRLNNSNTFTDQNYEGSNINMMIDIIAYSYHTLLFYLNQTSSESLFTQATLNENINKIVKLLNYNPIGNQSATLNFNAAAPTAILPGTYTIPRYSFFPVGGYTYVFNQDATFTKTLTSDETLSALSNETLLYQGTYVEYPSYFATGEPYELLTVIAKDENDNNVQIDHFNIDVYVKDNTKAIKKFVKYSPTDSFFLNSYDSTVYQIRLNESGNYEITFGNNTFGKQLNPGDEVAIYYLKTDGASGQVGIGMLNGGVLSLYNTSRFLQILTDTLPEGFVTLTSDQAALLQFTNTTPSTLFQTAESVDNIRRNSLNTYKTQFKLSTTTDIKTFVDRNFNNIVGSSAVVNNTEYINGHLKYYFDQGIEQPSMTSRVMLNQVQFSSSCNFNNLYLYTVPRVNNVTSLTTRLSYLNSAQKQFIIDRLTPYKISTSEIVVVDPVYMEVGFGLLNSNEVINPGIIDETFLQITVDGTLKRNFSYIQAQIAKIFTDFFLTTNDNLGVLIDLAGFSEKILTIAGVLGISTVRQNSNILLTYPGISLLVYNPVYSDTDINIVQQNIQLPYYKFPYLVNSTEFVNKIVLISSS